MKIEVDAHQIERIHHDVADEHMSAGQYLASRLPTLAPTFDRVDNPFKLLAMLNTQQWLFFLLGFAGWTWDAFDFFTISVSLTPIATSFNKTNAQISWGITLALMFRSVGSVIFGVWADRYGRKWPYVVNLILFIVLELATGFTQNFQQFLAVRSLYGIAMGGIYGMAAATALEDCPPRARGLISGMLQQGYAFGYLLATAFGRALVDTTPHGWRPLFWFGACPPALIIVFRLLMPETKSFQERQAVRAASTSVGKTFLQEAKVAIANHWLLLIYMVLLMSGMNFLSHGSQDLFPTLLTNQYNFSPNAVTVTQVVANLGAITGGTIIGYSSNIFGRRFMLLVMVICGGALIYPYTYTSSKAVIAAAFFMQFCVQGAWGIIPIHLMELSPGALRTFVVGTSYQLGNLASSASSTIEATIGEKYPLQDKINPKTHKHTKRYEYGKVMGIFLGCVYAYLLIMILIGPEMRGKDLSVGHDRDLQEATPEGFERAIGHDADSSSGDEENPKSQATRRVEELELK